MSFESFDGTIELKDVGMLVEGSTAALFRSLDNKRLYLLAGVKSARLADYGNVVIVDTELGEYCFSVIV